MTKDKLKELFAVECTETDGKGVTVIKGTPMDIINWINDKLDQETQRLKAELEREFCRGFEKATIKLRAEYEKVKAEKGTIIEVKNLPKCFQSLFVCKYVKCVNGKFYQSNDKIHWTNDHL